MNIIRFNKLKELKTYLILIPIYSFIPITFIFVFLNNIPIIFDAFKDYKTLGRSFFFPKLSYFNLFYFIPGNIIKLTLGQLIDIIIIANIFDFINLCLYNCFQRMYSNGYFYYINSLNSNLFNYKGNIQSQNIDKSIDQIEEFNYQLDSYISKFDKINSWNKINYYYNLKNYLRASFNQKITFNRNSLFAINNSKFVILHYTFCNPPYFKNSKVILLKTYFKAKYLFCIPFFGRKNIIYPKICKSFFKIIQNHIKSTLLLLKFNLRGIT